MSDPLSHAALKRAVDLSADIERQILNYQGVQPLIALLSKAQDYASTAVLLLADADAEDPKLIRKLQNDIRLYDLLLFWLKEIVAEGLEAKTILDEESRLDYAETVGLTADDDTELTPPVEDLR